MSRRRSTTGTTWDDAVADDPTDPSDPGLPDLALPPADPTVVQRVLDRVPSGEDDRDWGVVLPLHAAVLVEVDLGLSTRYQHLQADFDAAEAALSRRGGDAPGAPDVPTGRGSAKRMGLGAGASSVVLVVLMLAAWVTTLRAMREGFDGVTWTWVVAGGMVLALLCAVLLATPRLMARPVAPDWGRGTGFGLVAIPSTVVLGSVLLRIYGGSTISADILPQFVVLVAVAVIAPAAWLLLRDRTSGSERRAGQDAKAAADADELARTEALEERLDADLAALYAQVAPEDSRRALAVELAAQRRLYEDGRLQPGVARTAATEAVRRWR